MCVCVSLLHHVDASALEGQSCSSGIGGTGSCELNDMGVRN